MLNYARWKYVVLVLVLVASTLYALPNLFPPDSSVQVTAARSAPVDAALRERVAAALKAAGLQPKAIELDGENLLVRTRTPDAQAKAADALRPALGGDYVVALSLAPTAPDWLERIRARPMSLGLDLQGGVHFLMQVDRQAALQKRLEAAAEDVRSTLRQNRIGFQSVEARGSAITATLNRAEDQQRARELVTASQTAGTPLGGQPEVRVTGSGSTLTLELSEAALDRAVAEAIEQNVATLRNRVNSLGVAEPVIQRQGTDRIVVQLPGVQDTAQAKRILGATATLEYRAVVEGNAAEAERTGIVPAGARLFKDRDGNPVLLNRRVIASGDQLIGASTTIDPQSGTPAVSVRLNGVGGQRMYEFTSQNVGKPMAVVYIERVPEVRIVDGKEVRSTRTDEEVISVATIQGVFSNQFQTTGLTQKEASDLALLLRAGSLAAPMDFVEERVIGPSLGAENVERGLTAVAASFLLALGFFLIYYRMFGIITCLALLLNLLMLVAVMSLLGATLSLPGLAGIALTVGMSVDANVLINERIREELRAGMPPLSAIATGYDKASGTIADANITAILAGIALFAFGTGPVQGFAVALIVGILTSMYTAVSVSRGIATLIYGRRRKLTGLAI
ncbi:protein translocase subunit SecD [Tolypothrix campylonemoides VB511288]|nr:protein translocase subunit SecD [Tolypothrix campylonemoides VB511288]